MLLGAKRSEAEKDMHDVIAFEIELSMASFPFQVTKKFKVYFRL